MGLSAQCIYLQLPRYQKIAQYMKIVELQGIFLAVVNT